ncbi:hypothetical protein D0859_00598 [Hortaea werneckii]|uniref:Uncharacterized protein n=1 Tax=Hortaea werneckii TaxID=91943 RepID=A0A3M7JC07_HORWE|nr:hypothetical protein D0859_00598 [Hortaea werneckii]
MSPRCVKLETGWPYVVVNTWFSPPGADPSDFAIYTGDERMTDEGQGVSSWKRAGHGRFMIAWNEGYYSREHGLEDWPLVPIAPPPPPESPPPFNEGVFVEHDEVPPRRRLSPEPAFASPRTMARAMARTQLDIRADCEAAGLFTKKGPKSAKKAEAEEDGEEDGEWGGRGQKKKKGKKKEEKKEAEKKKQPQRGQKRKAWELPSEDDDDEEMEMEMEKENVAPPRGRPRPSYDFGYTAEEADNELTAQN